MWLMLQQDEPDDYVIATGKTHTVRDFCQLAFTRAGIQVEWQGSGLHEKGVERGTGRVLVEIDPRYLRPTEVDLLLGDATKAKQQLGWTPATAFEQLVEIMTDHDLQVARDEARLSSAR
jgi:GDPmannose 4,6-dehydratase